MPAHARVEAERRRHLTAGGLELPPVALLLDEQEEVTHHGVVAAEKDLLDLLLVLDEELDAAGESLLRTLPPAGD